MKNVRPGLSRKLLLILASMAFLTQAGPAGTAEAKKAGADNAPVAKKAKPDSPECIACLKEASNFFAKGKSTDALKILRSNQANCKDSVRFNLLLSTILLRMPSHEKEAAQAAELAHNLDPNSLTAAFQRALCLSACNEDERATEAYEKVVKLDPANYEAWSALGSLYEKIHEGQRAKQCQAKAAILEPNSRIAKIRTAQNLFKQGRMDAVAAELDRLIADDQLEPEFFIGLSKDALDMQSFGEAVRAADRALAAYPKLKEVLKTKSTALLWKRKYAEGLETISRVDDSCQDDTDVLAVRSLHLIKLGKTREAQKLVEKLPTRTTEAPLAALARAFMEERSGDTVQATKQLENALRHNQVFAPPHIELARIAFRQGRLEDAVSEAKEVQRSKPFISSGKAFESRVALEEAPLREKVAEALRLAREAVKLDGQDPEALVALALSDLKGGKTDSAQESIKKAIEIEPGNVDARLAEVKLEGEGNAEKRIRMLQSIRSMAPGDSEVLIALAEAHSDSGDLSSAIKLLKEDVDNNAAEANMVFALARFYERAGRSKEASQYFKQSLVQGLKGQKAALAREALKNIGSPL